ncbi:hypothetical protein PHYPSEUDO_014195 [Phytophthora pseudosyringae]|uniref:No apical meristem-associated C-terminal domain-containing protein n=1 Tax=Phytophthora pseudosyringae TaxID=221518 RepID=A0A8T1V546_9STRA|nr:hypothetical protein PHYPSEUDO_014195 [Phytophthora pseudosyringae]
MLSAFDSAELMDLTRAWVAVASDRQAHGNELFWDQVGVQYAASVPPTCRRPRTVEELQRQWKAMRPSMVAFVTLVSQKWKSSKPPTGGSRYHGQAFEFAVKTFRAATRRNFEYEAEAWLLVSQATWWTALKPQLMQQYASMHEEEEQERQERAECPVTPEDVSASPVCGRTRSRSDADDDEMQERRERRRLASEDLHSLTSGEEVQHSHLELPSEGSTVRETVIHTGADGAEQKTAGARVMERRLELDIMTQSGAGLSAEAKEYLHLQRQLILRRLKERIHQRLP